jgi:hypothetical protein
VEEFSIKRGTIGLATIGRILYCFRTSRLTFSIIEESKMYKYERKLFAHRWSYRKKIIFVILAMILVCVYAVYSTYELAQR